MVKAVKIVLSLPKPVLSWLQNRADEKYVGVNEHLRALIVDLYVNAQAVHEHSLVPDQGPITTDRGRHNKLKSLPRSGYKGVYPYGKRWAAVVSSGGSQERVAVCDTPEEAAQAYDRAMVERAGGNPRAAVNALAQQSRTAQAVDLPYFTKIARGESLSDVEMATWRRETNNVPDTPGAVPISMVPHQPANAQPLVRRSLRRGAGPAIDRPVEDPKPETGSDS